MISNAPSSYKMQPAKEQTAKTQTTRVYKPRAGKQSNEEAKELKEL